MNVINDFKQYIQSRHGNLNNLHPNEKENGIRRSELFIDYYEALVLVFERDIEPVRDMQAQLVEKKGIRVDFKR